MPDQFAPFQIPASPHTFTFNGRALVGFLTNWSGATERRHVIFKFPKRKGQRVEDMERDGRWLEVRLVFIGATCAADASAFEAFVDASPRGRLDHPVAGQWTAFCLGPQSSADFSQAINRIEIKVRFIEDELNAQVQVDTPDVGTASQNAASQQTVFQQSVANYLGALGKAQTQAVGALASIDAALATVTAVATPVTALQGAVNKALGTASLIASTINNIQAQSALFNADVSAFIAAATDLFSGTDTLASAAIDNIGNTLAQVQADAQALENLVTAQMPQQASALGGAAPAGSAQAVRDIELMVDLCLTLNDAVFVQLPPTIVYVNPTTQNLIVLAQGLMVKFGIVGRDPLSYASTIMGLNRISFPQAIPAGTSLTVPTA